MKRLTVPLTLVAVLAAVASAVAAPPLRPASTREAGTVWLGTVESVVDPTSFRLTDRLLITTDPMTVLTGFGAVSELEPGDFVQVQGELEGDALRADSVELLQPWAPASAIQGDIAYLVPTEQAFGLSDGTYALVNPGTLYIGVSSFDDLAVGDTVLLGGALDAWSGTIMVDRLERLGVTPPGFYTGFYGWVAGVTPPDRVDLDDGSVLQLSAATVLYNFASIGNLAVGDLLWIEAQTTDQPGTFDVLSLFLELRGGWTTQLEDTVTGVDPSGSFTTGQGYLVTVNPSTQWLGLSGLAELEGGDVVYVEGTVGSDPRLVQATLVELRSGGGGGGSGLVTTLRGAVSQLLPPATLMLDDFYLVAAFPATQWLGTLTGFGDLQVGMMVEVSVIWSPDGSLAATSVENLDPENSGVLILSGTVEEIHPSSSRYRLSGSEWLLIVPGTPVDGDVDSVEEIAVGMSLVAECVLASEGEYRALSVHIMTGGHDLPVVLAEPTEALVILAETANPVVVANRHGATIAGRLPGTLVHLFTWTVPVSEQQIQLLIDDPEVEEVEANYEVEDSEATRRRMPVADLFPTSGKYTQQSAATSIGLTAAHLRSTGVGALVAVVDTGVDPFHPLLRYRLAPGGYDFVDHDASPWDSADGLNQDGDSDVDEAAGHGTFVAGLVLLTAPGASILPYRVLDSEGHGGTFQICQAVIAAMDRGADVINMSFEVVGGDPASPTRSRVLDRILEEASRRGVVLVSGAGNWATAELPFPARDRRVLAVAAVDADGELAEFSNFGSTVALAAPGVEVYSGLWAQRFGTWSGTSMAAPLVSGAVALLRSVNPYLTPDEVAAALTQSAQLLQGDAHGVRGRLRVDVALGLVPDAP
jgi:hypothetical protein